MEKYAAVVDALQAREMISFLQDLIRIDSVFDPETEGANEQEAAEFVAAFLKREGFEVTLEQVVPGRPNVIAFYRGEPGGKTLLFEGHTDVVSPGDLEKWTYPPFGAEIHVVDGRERLYGRGACDTKNNLAAAIWATKAIKDSGVKFKGNIMLCIPCDEEGMMSGIKHFISQGWAKQADAGIICEPEEKQLCVEMKGAVRIGITVQGKMSHGAMPLAGNNPVWAVGKIINECRRLEDFEKDRVGYNPYLGWPSITPTTVTTPVKGVAQINVVPTDAYVTLDIRTVPGQDHEALKRQIQGILDRFAKMYPDGDEKFTASMEVIDDRPCTVTDKEEPVVKAIAKAYRDVMGKPETYNGVPGATDGTFLWKEGMPVVVTGAGDRLVPHQVDEWCEVEDIIETAKMYILAALYYLNEEY